MALSATVSARPSPPSKQRTICRSPSWIQHCFFVESDRGPIILPLAIVPRMHNLGQDRISDDLTGCWNEVPKENWKAASNRRRRRGELLTPHVAVRPFFSAIVISLLPSSFISPESISEFVVRWLQLRRWHWWRHLTWRGYCCHY